MRGFVGADADRDCGGQKAAFALIRPVSALARLIGELPRGVCCLACHDQLGLDPLAVGHIANGGSDEDSVTALNGAQADLEGKLRAVAPPSKQIQPRAHRAHAHIADVVLPVSDVAGLKTLRHQPFDVVADDFVVRIAE